MKKMKLFLHGCLFIISTIFMFSSIAEEKYEGIEIVVNINQADAEELETLLIGVGDLKAEAIVEYRTIHGEFIDVNDLMKVKGIGVKLLEKNRDRIQL